jgi:hypothetical protein
MVAMTASVTDALVYLEWGMYEIFINRFISSLALSLRQS